MKAIIILLLLSCGMAANAQSQQVDKAKEKKIPEVFKALATPDTVSLEEVKQSFEENAKRNWANNTVSGFNTISHRRLLINSPMASYSTAADQADVCLYILSDLRPHDYTRRLYLNKAWNKKTGVSDTVLLEKISKQYGNPVFYTHRNKEKDYIGFEAKWVNGTYASIRDPLPYYGFFVSAKMDWHHFKDGTETERMGQYSPTGRYAELAKRYSGVLIIDGSWWRHEFYNYQQQIISQDATHYVTRYDTNRVAALYSLFVTVDGSGHAHPHVLKVHKTRPENEQDIAELRKFFAELPAWSFSYLFTSDGRILPGRYLTAFRTDDYWRISDDLGKSVRQQ